MQTSILYIFTRTPLHVGAGTSVGAIDQPVMRERHTGFPIIPASSLKGSFADHWNDTLVKDEKGKKYRGLGEAAWLFGSDDSGEDKAAAGALLFTEARLLAFPIRSARGSYAWITSPLLLRRAVRDGALPITADELPDFPDSDEKALFLPEGKLSIGSQVVLEEYTFENTYVENYKHAFGKVGEAMKQLLPNDPVWEDINSRLVILSDGQMSYFTSTACEIAQHVRIDDETGTAAHGALFNQENVPSECLFYSLIHATKCRLNAGDHKNKSPEDALQIFGKKITDNKVFQFGGDASTGLGYCSVSIKTPGQENKNHEIIR